MKTSSCLALVLALAAPAHADDWWRNNQPPIFPRTYVVWEISLTRADMKKSLTETMLYSKPATTYKIVEVRVRVDGQEIDLTLDEFKRQVFGGAQ